MRGRLQLSLFFLTIAALLVLPFATYAAPPSPFVGQWQAIDVDGSDIRLAIGGPANGPFQITWTESYISFCEGEAGIVRGTGLLSEADANLLEADLHVECFTTGASTDFHLTWIYDPGTDTISNGVTTWHRPGGRGAKCLPPPAGLTGWWPGDGGADDIVSGRNGILRGDATTGSGLVDLAFSLDGDGDFVDVPDASDLNFGPGDFTIDLWVNFNDTSGEQVLVEKWIQGDEYVDGWTLTKLDGQVLRLATDSGGGNEADLDSEELAILPGIWYHFAARRQGPEVTLFVNGVPVAQDPDMGASNLNSESSLKFGHRGDPEDTPGSTDERGFYLNGRIDEVELFVGTALSGDQILAIYQAGSAGKCKDAIQSPPTLDLRVNYGHDWVESFYEGGHAAWVTVTDSDGNVRATSELVTEPKDYWGGETGFQTNDSVWFDADGNQMEYPPDIQPYDWVYGWVDNGASAQVQIGEISGAVHLAGDFIEGTIHAPWFSSEVEVDCHSWGAPLPAEILKFDTVLPNGEDTYLCSWAGEWDIQPYQDVGVGYSGPDGHWVANAFFIPNPWFTAFPEQEVVEAWDWPLGTSVHLTINDPNTDPSPDYEQTEVVVLAPWESGDPWVWFDFAGAYNMKAGDVVTLTDGITERTHVVQNLSITAVYPEENTVAGTSDSGQNVTLWSWEAPPDKQMQVTADDFGNWVADFDDVDFDLVPGYHVRAEVWDEAGNDTAVDWSVPPPPSLLVQITEDWFEAQNFTPNAELTFWIYDAPGGAQVKTGTMQADDYGTVGIWVGDTVDLIPGNYLVVSDGSTTKELELEDLTFDLLDLTDGHAEGTAPEPYGRLVWVGIGFEEDGWSMEVFTASDGSWVAGFSAPVPVDYQWVAAQVFDEDGDASEVRPSQIANGQP